MSHIFSSSFKLPSSNRSSDYFSARKRKKQMGTSTELNKNHILVVEDDEELVAIYNVLRFENQWPIFLAQNSTEAMSHLCKQSFDVMILDWNLPDFNGDALIKISETLYDHKCKSAGYIEPEKTPIITFSTEDQSVTQIEDSKYFYRHDHWNKPFKVAQVKEKLHKLIYSPIDQVK